MKKTLFGKKNEKITPVSSYKSKMKFNQIMKTLILMIQMNYVAYTKWITSKIYFLTKMILDK